MKINLEFFKNHWDIFLIGIYVILGIGVVASIKNIYAAIVFFIGFFIICYYGIHIYYSEGNQNG